MHTESLDQDLISKRMNMWCTRPSNRSWSIWLNSSIEMSPFLTPPTKVPPRSPLLRLVQLPLPLLPLPLPLPLPLALALALPLALLLMANCLLSFLLLVCAFNVNFKIYILMIILVYWCCRQSDQNKGRQLPHPFRSEP